MSKLNDDIARNTNTYRPVYESSGVPGVLGLVHQISAPSDGGASKTRLLQIAGLVQAALEAHPDYRTEPAEPTPTQSEDAPEPAIRRSDVNRVSNLVSEAAKDLPTETYTKRKK